MKTTRDETLRDNIATILQAASKTTKSAYEVAGVVMAAIKADKQRRARKPIMAKRPRHPVEFENAELGDEG